METRLYIEWDGSVPGLEAKRLSLVEFGRPLQLLTKAVRRIGSNLLTDAAGETSRGPLRREAKLLDLEIQSLSGHSVGVEAFIVLREPRGMNQTLIEDLTRRTGETLLHAIDQESKGHLHNKAVRKYLRSLPSGVSRQKYVFQSNGAERTLRLSELELPKSTAQLPHFSRVTGRVSGVGFEPGELNVRLRIDGGASVSCTAEAHQVEAALRLRDQEVEAFVVISGNRKRLLNLEEAGSEADVRSQSQRDETMHERWGDLLERLSR